MFGSIRGPHIVDQVKKNLALVGLISQKHFYGTRSQPP